MSSTLDPAKLKVVELRAELSKRGLDPKGNKPALVKRLKEALETELKEELPDTSIADTSTEDLDTSQTENQSATEESIVHDNKVEKVQESSQEEKSIKNDAPNQEEKMDVEDLPPPVEQKSIEQSDGVDVKENTDKPEETGESSISESKENGEQEDDSSQKSQLNSDSDTLQSTLNEEKSLLETTTEEKIDDDSEAKGEKRKRSSPSPDRTQRRRSKSPIKEDEPPIDQDKVQLSWYDSDLHLQVDKESFLSAKPYHEGAFGFAWAGVRATHGVNNGKVCFEVKITEELKWEDFSKYYDRHRREQNKFPPKQKTDDDKKDDLEKRTDIEGCTEQGNGTKVESMSENETKDAENSSVEESKKTEEMDSQTIKVESNLEEKIADEKAPPDEETEKTEQPKEQSDDKDQAENKDSIEPLPTHLFRVGWSLLSTGLQLGEDKYSYGYESSGKFVVNKELQNYGIKFGVGDVIASFLNVDDNGITISYAINGVSQSQAITIPSSEIPENLVLFPHVLSRNYAFELNLGSKEESWYTKPQEFADYQFLDKIENKIPGPVRPDNRSDCEVILMCGLPASGKTHWVQEYVKANPDKRYTVLGNTHLLEKMTVAGYELKTKYKGSWNVLLEKLQKCLNKLIEVAALRRRNYIIDQPNVYPSAQRRKLRPFEGFKRRAVVVVVGDEEQAKRQSLQEAEGGKDVPDSVVLDMKANMSLPQKGDWLDEVEYVGVGEEEAKTLVQKYNTQARETIGVQRRFSHRDDRNRWQNRRNDYRGSYRDRNYHNNRYDRGPPRPGNWHPRQGGWNRDRRDNRGPPMGGPRDWRNRGNTRDRGNREIHNQGNSYNRNRNQPGRGHGGNWSTGWNQNQSSWGNQPWSGQSSWGPGWSSQNNQSQWKYGGGSQGGGYGSYSNWNYYGQYPQNWGQGQSSGNTPNQYGQYSQQDWAQYAQQYAQQGQNTSGSTTQSTSQK